MGERIGDGALLVVAAPSRLVEDRQQVHRTTHAHGK